MTLATRSFAADGVCIRTAVLPSCEAWQLRDLPGFSSGTWPGSRTFGLCPEIARLAGPHGTLNRIADELMETRTKPVRILYFDKTPEVNWAVAWHQDRTIAVAERVDVPGFGPWSIKAGVHHVEPPDSILRDIVSLRLHLDDCGPDNGPLMVLLGSFRLGRVPAQQIRQHVGNGAIEVCCAKAGDVVAMRGLTIHASERALQPGHRRVLHVDFSASGLPEGLRWALA